MSKPLQSTIKHIDFYVINLLSLIAAFYLSFYIKFKMIFYDEWSIFIIVMVLVNIIINLLLSPYSKILKRQYYEDIFNIFQVALFNLISVGIILFLLRRGATYSRFVVFMTYGLYFAFNVVLSCLWKSMLLNGKSNSRFLKKSPIIVISTSDRIEETIKNIKASDLQLFDIDSVCLLDDAALKESFDLPVIIMDESFIDYVRDHAVKDLFVDVKTSDLSNDLFASLVNDGVSLHFDLSASISIENENYSLSEIGICHTLDISNFTFSTRQKAYFILKRIFDILFGLLGCIVMVPIMAAVKISYIASGDKASIFYTQTRIGKDGIPFKMYKFRSMVPNADVILKDLLKDEKIRDEWEKNQKLEHDPRITKMGGILRKTSLDELPQFINVLKGDMSFIGPRPLVPGELEAHGGLPIYNFIKPGLTGWWGCNGRSNIEYKERLNLEYYYVKNCSLLLDIICIVRTVFVVIKKEGAK